MDYNALKNISLFEDLSDNELVKIWEHVQTRNYKKNNIILFEEDTGESLFIINNGKVKITRLSEDGKEVILSILGECDFFGEMALLDGDTRSANVISMGDSEVFVLKRSDFFTTLERNPKIAVTLLQELAARLRKSDQQIEHLSLSDAENRVAATLLRLAEDIGIYKMGQVRIDELPMQQDMANMAGTSRETISRMLSNLKERGYIEKKGHKLTIIDFEKFKADFSKTK